MKEFKQFLEERKNDSALGPDEKWFLSNKEYKELKKAVKRDIGKVQITGLGPGKGNKVHVGIKASSGQGMETSYEYDKDKKKIIL